VTQPGATSDAYRDDVVIRSSIEVGNGQHVSARVWGNGEPEAVLIHGSGQNAHTWDTVARLLERPIVAVDLPGHGHSDWRDDHNYGPLTNADAVAVVVKELAPRASIVIGMSLGGLTLMHLAAQHPELVRRAVILDTTPAGPAGDVPVEQQGAVALLRGPSVFDSFDDMVAAAAAVVHNRPPEAIARGVLRNARQLEDGRWTWRYDTQPSLTGTLAESREQLWRDLSSISIPLMLVRSGRSGRVLDSDVAEFLRRQPGARVEVVEDAGHSIQSDQPAQLVDLVRDFLATTAA
jgi:esterase